MALYTPLFGSPCLLYFQGHCRKWAIAFGSWETTTANQLYVANYDTHGQMVREDGQEPADIHL